MQSIESSVVSPWLDIVLTQGQHEIIVTIAERFDLEPEDVIAWAVALLQRYVDAGGEP